MGHHHLMVPDPAVHKKIWVEVLGAQASGNPGLEFLKLPGTFLILSQGKPSGGSEGTSLDHFAFAVKEYDATRDKLAAAGVKISNERTQGQREFVAMFPDDVKVEFYGVNVKNVNEYCQKLAGLGIQCERPTGNIAMVTDPAGTRIEINQGLESR